MSSTEPDREVVLDADPSESRSTVRIQRRPVHAPLFGLLLALGLGTLALVVLGGGRGDTPETAATSTTVPPGPDSARPPSTDPPSTGDSVAGSADDLTITVLLTSPVGDPAEVVVRRAGTSGLARHRLPGDLHAYELDASGRWVAGWSASSFLADHVLWTGPVDGPLEPIAVGVAGFAWHERRPGVLAWTGRGGNDQHALHVIDLTRAHPAIGDLAVNLEGRLRFYGDPGFVIELDGPGQQLRLIGPSGGAAVTVLGFSPQALADGTLSVAGEQDTPHTTDPARPETRWFGVDVFARVVVASTSAAVDIVVPEVGDLRARPTPTHLLLVDGDRTVRALVTNTTGWATPARSVDSRFVAFARQGGQLAPTISVLDTDTGAESSFVLEGVNRRRGFVSGIRLEE